MNLPSKTKRYFNFPNEEEVKKHIKESVAATDLQDKLIKVRKLKTLKLDKNGGGSDYLAYFK